jgi:predicted SAM-dependent methyltransferase
MRLNLGCGKHKWPGFVNVDMKHADVECDLRKLPFENDSADEIHAIHVFEHFYRWDAEAVLAEWWRVLKPGCRIAIELPCWDKLRKFDTPKTSWAFYLGLYGDPQHKDPGMVHHWCYTVAELKELMEVFREVKVMEPYFHKADRDIRIEGVK